MRELLPQQRPPRFASARVNMMSPVSSRLPPVSPSTSFVDLVAGFLAVDTEAAGGGASRCTGPRHGELDRGSGPFIILGKSVPGPRSTGVVKRTRTNPSR